MVVEGCMEGERERDAETSWRHISIEVGDLGRFGRGIVRYSVS
jgi:hypothetical protein